jgi:hypothetical protein
VSVPVRSLVAAVLVLATTASPAAAARASRTQIDPDWFVSFAVDVDQLVGGTFSDPGGGTNEIRVAPTTSGVLRCARSLARSAPRTSAWAAARST